jgi:hypothetical protein
MPVKRTRQNTVYGFPNPNSNLFPDPQVQNRAPTSYDQGEIGQPWVDPVTNSAWMLTSTGNWESITGGSGSFSTLVVTGNSTLGSAAGSTVTLGNLSGATAVAINSGTGNTVFDSAAEIEFTAGTAFAVTASSGDITFTTTSSTDAGAIAFTSLDGGIQFNSELETSFATTNATFAVTTGTGAINIGTDAHAKPITIGDITAGTTLALNTPTGTPVVAANGLTATVGNITATNGNIVLSTATNLIQLPGPVNIMSGAGAPASGLALHVGDMYINTTAASATTRIYIATAAGTWTNFTCAA